MESHINFLELLGELKGAPLSILVFLSLSGNRCFSATELQSGTGFSDKPVREGLLRLRELGMITEPQTKRFQLVGKEFQLPLYWDEKMESFGDFPKLSGVSPSLDDRVAALEKAVFGDSPNVSGVSPIVSGDSPNYYDSALIVSDQVSGVRDQDEGADPDDRSGNFAEMFGVSPSVPGDSPILEIEGQWADDNRCQVSGVRDQDEDLYSGNFPEKFGDSPIVSGDSPKVLINNITNPCDKEVGKYADQSTYLPVVMSNSSEVNTRTGEIPDAVPNFRIGGQEWKSAMERLKNTVDKQTYNTIMEQAVLLGAGEGLITIGLKNSFVRDWAEKLLRDTLENIFSDLAGSRQRISFVLTDEFMDERRKHFRCHAAIMRNKLTALDETEPAVLLPERLEVSADPKGHEAENVRICNEYLDDGNEKGYSLDDLRGLVNMDPDPDLLRFALENLSGLTAAKKWCSWKYIREAKSKLLSHYGVDGKALLQNPAVSLEIIREVCEDLKETGEPMKYAISRIQMRANGNIPF